MASTTSHRRMKRADDIGRFQSDDRAKRPWIYAVEAQR